MSAGGSERAGRREPYTEAGIARLACVRCGARARFQWNACADGNLWRPICGPCDVGLNLMALLWMNDPQAEEKAKAYAVARGIGL